MDEARTDDFGALPPSQARRVDAACRRFEQAWRDGGSPRIEDHLDDVEEPRRAALLRELLALELELRRDRGERPAEAQALIERAVALRPDDGYIVDSLGWAYFRTGRYAQAVETLERAVVAVPDDPTINDHLGDAYWRTGRRAEARFAWKAALASDPDAETAKRIAAKLDFGLDVATARK